MLCLEQSRGRWGCAEPRRDSQLLSALQQIPPSCLFLTPIRYFHSLWTLFFSPIFVFYALFLHCVVFISLICRMSKVLNHPAYTELRLTHQTPSLNFNTGENQWKFYDKRTRRGKSKEECEGGDESRLEWKPLGAKWHSGEIDTRRFKGLKWGENTLMTLEWSGGHRPRPSAFDLWWRN